ncbi:MAG TPA: 4a-hydroxytetrahydrobiopterin dehydratase [Thermomicrobiales bacterium]|nr:4a-hydroxytetrahydrobiopterin dehydratase [Thermomicrobiales bacterium]
MELAHEQCESCHTGATRVADDELASLLAAVPGWELVTVGDIPRLRRVFRMDGWEPAVSLSNRIAEAAREQDHHPSILIEWGKVTVEWWTHSIRGLHRNDFVMAAKVNDIVSIK